MLLNKIDSEIPQKMFQHTKNSKKNNNNSLQVFFNFCKLLKGLTLNIHWSLCMCTEWTGCILWVTILLFCVHQDHLLYFLLFYIKMWTQITDLSSGLHQIIEYKLNTLPAHTFTLATLKQKCTTRTKEKKLVPQLQ